MTEPVVSHHSPLRMLKALVVKGRCSKDFRLMKLQLFKQKHVFHREPLEPNKPNSYTVSVRINTLTLNETHAFKDNSTVFIRNV